MENSSKLSIYTTWVDRIKNASDEDFFPLLIEFFDLLVNENSNKVKLLEGEISDINFRKGRLAEKALGELRSLLKEIEREVFKEGVRTLPEIERYRMLLQPSPDDLFNAIRHTLEDIRNSGKFEGFRKDLFSEESGFYYIDLLKFCEAYPSFRDYMEFSSQIDKDYREEIPHYVAYDVIRSWADGSFREDLPVEPGKSVRSRIIKCLSVLILYFSTGESLRANVGKPPIWEENFRFESNTLILPPYGECEFSKKTFGKNPEVNRRAVLIEAVLNGKLDGVDSSSIRRCFKEKGLRKPENREIDAMIIQINRRFSKSFKKANVCLENIGSSGLKIVRLSVYPHR